MSELPRLQAIVDVEYAVKAGWAPADLARAFLDGGATFLQVRGKHLSSGALLDVCVEVMRLAEPCRAAVIVNDRIDVARLAGMSGVHVGQDDASPQTARHLLGDTAIVGWSTHTPLQVAGALDLPVTYLAIGPVFGTHTKDTGYDPRGLEAVRAAAIAAGRAARPVVAIGGITVDRVRSVREAGAHAVAVIADLLNGDPAVQVGRFLRELDGVPA
ncbi:MAG: thiamine phosphate synthase [Vicinamibacterales bacterium]